MWDHDFPAGIAPAEHEQALPTRHFAPVEDARCFVSYYAMIRILAYILLSVS